MLRQLLRETLFWAWKARGYLPWTVHADGTHRLTVIVPSYHVRRARNVEPLVRACLKCAFVERVVVSNHNPAVQLADWVRVEDRRLQIIEQGQRRGCGFAWTVAEQQHGQYYLVIDDDQLLYPSQIARLFRALVAAPEVPHGLCGGRGHDYYERCDAAVDVLYNVYAVTRAHVETFHALVRRLQASGRVLADEIEYLSDDIVVSRTGRGTARIHDVGFVLRCRTGAMPGIAIFKETGFYEVRARVDAALASLGGH